MATVNLKMFPNTGLLLTDFSNKILGVILPNEDSDSYANTIEQMICEHENCEAANLTHDVIFDMNSHYHAKVYCLLFWEDQPQSKETYILKSVTTY